MTFPVWIEVGSLRLHPHLVFELTAYAVGFALYRRQRRILGDAVDAHRRWSLVAAAVIGATIGARVLDWLEDPASLLAQASTTPAVLGGKTLVGALLGGWIAVEIQKRRDDIRRRTGDLFAVPLAVGIAIGRIGCFLSGLGDGTYGTATALPWGVDLGDGVSRHPTALYESLFAIVLAAVLIRVQPRLAEGATFRLFIGAYLAFRLAIDTLKPEPRMAAGLTSIQLAAVVGLLALAVERRRRGGTRLT